MSKLELFEKVEIYKEKFNEVPFNVHKINDERIGHYLNLLDYAIFYDEKIKDDLVVFDPEEENQIL